MSQNITIHSVKNEIKNTISLGFPLIASQLVYSCSGFIGTAMVAHLGADALAASVLVSMIWMSLSVFFFGMLNAASVLVSHQFGAKNDAAISRIMGQAYILGMLMCGILILVLFCLPVFLTLSHQPPAVLNLAKQYMHALLWTIPGLMALIISEQFLAAIGRTKIVLRISTLVVPVEIPIIYMLIFGKFGLPACGVAGVGYGFAVTYTVSSICLIIYLLTSKHYEKYKIFAGINRIDFTTLKELIRIGLPIGMMHAIEVSAFAVSTFIIARFGTVILAAHQIVLQYLGFTITIVFAMSQAVSIRVGHAVGRQDLSGIKYASYTGMVLNFSIVSIIALAFILFPTFFLTIDFNINDPKNAALIHDSAMLLSIGALLIMFDNFRIIGFGALRGLKDTRFPMVASLISFWLIGLSTAYLLAFDFHLQGKGVWWGLTLGIFCGAIIVLIRLEYLLRKVDLAKLIGMHSV